MRTHQKSPPPINFEDRRRLVMVAVGLFFLFCLLIIQFYKVQITEGEKWAKEAQAQHEMIVVEPFKRGTFFSNTSVKLGQPENIQPLAVDVQKFHLYADPSSIPPLHRDEIAHTLGAFLGEPPETQSSLRADLDRKSRSRKLATWLDEETREAITHWWHDYAREKKIARNALFFMSDYRRSYPFGKLLGQVLHTIRDDKDEVTKQGLPTGGLELYFNDLLKGQQGKRRLTHSPRHALEMGELLEAPENGADIYLTINHYLQAIAEEEIAKGVEQAKAKNGWAVMMNPRTGEILALAQYPFFYPEKYRDYFNDLNLMDITRVKAVSDAQEPGSVMKALTITVALKANEELKSRGEKELFNPLEKMATANGHFPGRSRPLTDTHLHHFLNLYLGMQKSSNVYMARLMQRVIDRLGSDWYRRTLEETFGLGQKTLVELPAETWGNLPTPGKKHPNGALEWSQGTPYSLAIGHNILVTSVQMLRAYSVFANGGYCVQPTLVRKIVRTHADGTQEVLLDNTRPERVAAFPKVLDQEIINQVVAAMKSVTKPGGTAPKADVNGYTEAGKTGTAEKVINGVYSKNCYFSSFVGFTPVTNPQFLLIIAIDEPAPIIIPGVGKNYHGGNCAAPVFRAIAQRSLEYLGITPDDPYGYPRGDPRRDSKRADWYPELQRLQEIYNKWNH